MKKVAAIHNIALDIDRNSSALEVNRKDINNNNNINAVAVPGVTSAFDSFESDRGLAQLLEHVFNLPIVNKRAKTI